MPLIFGLEFGDLDPWFFINFITSTPQYRPIPVPLYSAYEDGRRINNKMLELGKFEHINSNIGNKQGVVVTDRDKISIEVIKPVSTQATLPASFFTQSGKTIGTLKRINKTLRSLFGNQ